MFEIILNIPFAIIEFIYNKIYCLFILNKIKNKNTKIADQLKNINLKNEIFQKEKAKNNLEKDINTVLKSCFKANKKGKKICLIENNKVSELNMKDICDFLIKENFKVVYNHTNNGNTYIEIRW